MGPQSCRASCEVEAEVEGKRIISGFDCVKGACPQRESWDNSGIALEPLMPLSVHEEVGIAKGALFNGKSNLVDCIPMSETNDAMYMWVPACTALVHKRINVRGAERACV